MIVTILSANIIFVMSKYSTMFMSGEDVKAGAFYGAGLMKMALIAVTVVIPFILMSTYITWYMNLCDCTPLNSISLAAGLTLLVPVNLCFTQAPQGLNLFSASMRLRGGLKLLLGVILVLLGFMLDNATASFTMSWSTVFFLSALPLAGYLRGGCFGENSKRHKRDIPASFGLVFSSAVVMLSSAIFCLHQIFVFALSPIFRSETSISDYRAAFGLLDRVLVYTLLVAASGTGILIFLFELITRLCFGRNYITTVPLNKYYIIAMMFIAVLNIPVSFCMTRFREFFLFFLALRLRDPSRPP